jgi:hypothetical protein
MGKRYFLKENLVNLHYYLNQEQQELLLNLHVSYKKNLKGIIEKGKSDNCASEISKAVWIASCFLCFTALNKCHTTHQ